MIGPYDFGLYHLQVIKWAENFQIVKGIGNLHHRLDTHAAIGCFHHNLM